MAKDAWTAAVCIGAREYEAECEIRRLGVSAYLPQQRKFGCRGASKSRCVGPCRCSRDTFLFQPATPGVASCTLPATFGSRNIYSLPLKARFGRARARWSPSSPGSKMRNSTRSRPSSAESQDKGRRGAERYGIAGVVPGRDDCAIVLANSRRGARHGQGRGSDAGRVTCPANRSPTFCAGWEKFHRRIWAPRSLFRISPEKSLNQLKSSAIPLRPPCHGSTARRSPRLAPATCSSAVQTTGRAGSEAHRLRDRGPFVLAAQPVKWRFTFSPKAAAKPKPKRVRTDETRAYMREYMRERRAREKADASTNC